MMSTGIIFLLSTLLDKTTTPSRPTFQGSDSNGHGLFHIPHVAALVETQAEKQWIESR